MSLQGVRVEDICRVTAYQCNLVPNDLRSPDRHRRVAWPRMVAMHMMRERGRSLADIGAFFGVDHTTVLSGLRRVSLRLQTERQLHADIGRIRSILAMKPRPFEIQAAECVGRGIAAFGDWCAERRDRWNREIILKRIFEPARYSSPSRGTAAVCNHSPARQTAAPSSAERAP